MYKQSESRYECPKCKYITTVRDFKKIWDKGTAICENCRKPFMV